jgi:5-oxoprolinase (ATP-hydrolysing) subunit A
VTIALEPFGDGAWRARLPEGANGRAVLDALRSLPGVVDAVVSERHALIAVSQATPPVGVEDTIERALRAKMAAGGTRHHVVGVRYDGEDLDEVARIAGLEQSEIIALHAERTYVVASIGFLPGFAYLRGLESRIIVPRRSAPRTRIAPLSIGIGGPYTGVYPFASPGGWHIIGHAVAFTPFDAQHGARLALGDRVALTRSE